MSAAEPSAEQLAGPELDWAKTAGNRGGPQPTSRDLPIQAFLIQLLPSEGTRMEETDEVPVQQECSSAVRKKPSQMPKGLDAITPLRGQDRARKGQSQRPQSSEIKQALSHHPHPLSDPLEVCPDTRPKVCRLKEKKVSVLVFQFPVHS